MKTKRILYTLCSVAVMAVAAFVAYTEIHNRRQMSDLTRKNLIALTSDETIDGGSGLLWEKHWVTCPIAGQIIVTKGTETIAAGVYVYSVSLLVELSQSTAVYTVVESHVGQKSYCYDGWNLCKKDECR